MAIVEWTVWALSLAVGLASLRESRRMYSAGKTVALGSTLYVFLQLSACIVFLCLPSSERWHIYWMAPSAFVIGLLLGPAMTLSSGWRPVLISISRLMLYGCAHPAQPDFADQLRLAALSDVLDGLGPQGGPLLRKMLAMLERQFGTLTSLSWPERRGALMALQEVFARAGSDAKPEAVLVLEKLIVALDFLESEAQAGTKHA